MSNRKEFERNNILDNYIRGMGKTYVNPFGSARTKIFSGIN